MKLALNLTVQKFNICRGKNTLRMTLLAFIQDTLRSISHRGRTLSSCQIHLQEVAFDKSSVLLSISPQLSQQPSQTGSGKSKMHWRQKLSWKVRDTSHYHWAARKPQRLSVPCWGDGSLGLWQYFCAYV